MAHQALYRAWRSRRFEDIVGQDVPMRTLKNQVQSGRVAHAYLFCGSRGTGKTSAARILARAVNCLDSHEGEPCGKCEACIRLQQGTSMDVLEIDAASNNGVEDVRALIEKVKYPPVMEKKRVYIIDEVHMFSTAAFNALLKTLEEPPDHALFILATTDPQKLPPTVVSRCQQFDFKRIPARLIVSHLGTIVASLDRPVQSSALEAIARSAEGGMRDAISLLDLALGMQDGELTEDTVVKVLGGAGRQACFSLAEAMIHKKSADALTVLDTMLRSGGDPLTLARDIAAHLRQLMIAQVCGEGTEAILDITQEDAAALAKQASAGGDRLIYILECFLRAQSDMKWLSSARVALELAAVRACGDAPATGADAALLARLEALEKGAPRQVAPAAERAAAPQAATRPAPAPRPASTASSGASADSDDPWKQALGIFRKEAMPIYAVISRALGADVSGDTVIVRFAPAHSVCRDSLQTPAFLPRVQEVFSRVLGRSVQVTMSCDAPTQAKKPAVESDRTEKMRSVFGSDIVSVVSDWDEDA